jgi:hypothetical protein
LRIPVKPPPLSQPTRNQPTSNHPPEIRALQLRVGVDSTANPACHARSTDKPDDSFNNANDVLHIIGQMPSIQHHIAKEQLPDKRLS